MEIRYSRSATLFSVEDTTKSNTPAGAASDPPESKSSTLTDAPVSYNAFVHKNASDELSDSGEESLPEPSHAPPPVPAQRSPSLMSIGTDKLNGQLEVAESVSQLAAVGEREAGNPSIAPESNDNSQEDNIYSNLTECSTVYGNTPILSEQMTATGGEWNHISTFGPMLFTEFTGCLGYWIGVDPVAVGLETLVRLSSSEI